MRKKIIAIILSLIVILLIVVLLIIFPPHKGTQSAPPQAGFVLGEVYKIWHPKRVTVSDGFTFRYNLWDKYDTAIYYSTGADTFEVVTTFKKIDKGLAPPLPDLITSVDDNVITTGQVYNPPQNAGDNIFITSGWNHFKSQTWNEPHYNKTLSFVDKVAGAYIELTCDPCYKIEWWSEKRVNHGIATVQIDGGEASEIDLYDVRDDNNSLKVFTTPALTNAKHTLRVNYTGRKNSAANATNLGHDKFVTYTKQ